VTLKEPMVAPKRASNPNVRTHPCAGQTDNLLRPLFVILHFKSKAPVSHVTGARAGLFQKLCPCSFYLIDRDSSLRTHVVVPPPLKRQRNGRKVYVDSHVIVGAGPLPDDVALGCATGNMGDTSVRAHG
jgi:hypothetical protein